MIRAEEQTPNPLEKIKLLFEIGTILRERLDDEKKGAEFSPVSCSSTQSTSVPPSRWLSCTSARDVGKNLSRSSTRWSAKADKRDAKEMNNLYFRVAKTADARQPGQGPRYFKMAYDLDSTSLQTLMGRADLLYRLEDWEGR